MLSSMTIRASDQIGKRIAEYRRLAGLSARELAERAGTGLTRGVIANLESGRKSDLTVDQLLAISATLGVPPMALALPIDRPFEQIEISDGTAARTAPTWVAREWMQHPDSAAAFAMGDTKATAVARQILRMTRQYVDGQQALHLAEAQRAPDAMERRAALDELASDLRALGVDLEETRPASVPPGRIYSLSGERGDGEHQTAP